MLELRLPPAGNRPLKILCLGAHCDDIEIGCGGTILTLARQHRNLDVTWVVFCSTPARAREARAAAALFLRGVATSNVVIKDFRDGFLPYTGYQVKECFEELKGRVNPDIVFTHYRHDLHQDHRLLCELTWNTYRNHLIFEYEVPKYDGDLGSPNVFVPLESAVTKRKLRIIREKFGSQRSKHWFTEDTLLALLRLRGVESGGTTLHAEAFYARKVSILNSSR